MLILAGALRCEESLSSAIAPMLQRHIVMADPGLAC